VKEFYGMLNSFFYNMNTLSENKEGDELSDYDKIIKESKRGSKGSR
jgi:hypothetical protein